MDELTKQLTMEERVAAYEAAHPDLVAGLKAGLAEVVEHNRAVTELLALRRVASAARAVRDAAKYQHGGWIPMSVGHNNWLSLDDAIDELDNVSRETKEEVE